MAVSKLGHNDSFDPLIQVWSHSCFFFFFFLLNKSPQGFPWSSSDNIGVEIFTVEQCRFKNKYVSNSNYNSSNITIGHRYGT